MITKVFKLSRSEYGTEPLTVERTEVTPCIETQRTPAEKRMGYTDPVHYSRDLPRRFFAKVVTDANEMVLNVTKRRTAKSKFRIKLTLEDNISVRYLSGKEYEIYCRTAGKALFGREMLDVIQANKDRTVFASLVLRKATKVKAKKKVAAIKY